MRKQLQSYAGRRIDKVIDVRGNGGGSDLAWMDILAAITDRDDRARLPHGIQASVGAPKR